MSSPKKSDYLDLNKKIIRKDTKTIIRIHNGNRLYGTLRIINMIPIPITELEPYILSKEPDLKYKQIILGELRYINNNKDKIVKYANIVYNHVSFKSGLNGHLKNNVEFMQKKAIK